MTVSKANLTPIKLMIFDVDGVLTNGEIIYLNRDQEIKKFNVQDGFGITLARRAGIKLGILTGRDSPMVARRAEELKFDYVEQGHFNKLDAFKNILQAAGCDKSQTLYCGDDILDLVVRPHAGVFVAPNNARDRVKQESDWVTVASGGEGCVREIIDCVLGAQDKLTVTENSFIEETA